MKPYQVLFFDLDHTLIDTRGQYQKSVQQTLQTLYGDEAPGEFTDRFLMHHERLWSLYDRRELTMQQLRRQRFLLTWNDYGITRTVEEADRFQTAYDATFETTLHAFPGTVAMLERLAAQYRMGIITNGSPDLQWRKLRITGLDRFFAEEHLIISERIGKAKPDPTVYQAACDALSVQPQEALMVGDNYRSDVLGARDFGMDAVWYGPDETILSSQRAVTEEAPLSRPEELLERIAALEGQRQV